MPEQYTNLANSTTVGSIDGSTNPITFSVQSGDGALFPSTANGNFRVTVCDTNGANAEVMMVTSRATDTFTASRGAGATGELPVPTLVAHAGGSIVSHDITVGAMQQIRSDINQFGVRASLPGTAGQVKGARYNCTDSPYNYIFDGTVWQPYVFGFNVVEPMLSSFTQVRVDRTTFGTSNGGIIWSVTGNSAAEDFQYIAQAIPGTGSYYVDAAFICTQVGAVGGAGCGLAAATNTGSAFAVIVFGGDTGAGGDVIEYKLYNSVTSQNTQTVFGGATFAPLVWTRWLDDRTTNRTGYVSLNGQTWIQVKQESRTNLFTPAFASFGITPFNANVLVHLVHFSIHT